MKPNDIITRQQEERFHPVQTCKSFWGFQSESNIITVSAVARLIPRPPARVERRKQKSSLPGALKWSIACWRNSDFVLPSSLWNWNPLSDIYSASISSILTIYNKSCNHDSDHFDACKNSILVQNLTQVTQLSSTQS